MKMYELVGVFKELEAMEIDSETFQDTLDSIDWNEEFEQKADNMASLFKGLKYEAEAIKAEEKALAERRKAIENKADKLKRFMFDTFKLVNKDKVETARNKLVLRKNPPAVELANIDWYNDDYMEKIETVKLDKAKLKEDLKAGIEIEGARLVQGERLDIK